MKIILILPNSTCRLWCRIEKYKGGLCSDCPTELLSLLPNNQPCSLWEELHHLQVWSDGKLITLISIQEKTFIMFGENSFIFEKIRKRKILRKSCENSKKIQSFLGSVSNCTFIHFLQGSISGKSVYKYL